MTLSRKIAIIIIIIGVLVGFIDSAYLFYKYVTADTINCFLFEGCNTVAKSPYSHILGIPLPTFGLIFYGAVFLIMIFFIKIGGPKLEKLLLLGTFCGFLFSLYFIYLQGFVIGAFCIYCLISAFASMLDFCAAIYITQSPKTAYSDIIKNNYDDTQKTNL